MGKEKIQTLPPSTVRQIGSGQVISSVFSVVKELIENSIDAGATSVEIRLDCHGLERIEITDNGFGVEKKDVPFMAKRHYTSKLSSVDDLKSLNSYGFRGEALASLCSVSDVTITTKTKTDDVSTSYILDKEGNITSKKPSYLGQGTSICAQNLFANLPVRRQYYSNTHRRKEDLKRIEEIVLAYCIIKPNIRLSLRHGKETIWSKSAMFDSKSVLQHLFGRQIVSNMFITNRQLESAKASLTLFVPKAGTDVKAMSRSSTDRTFVVVNERPVQVKEFLKVLRLYYSNCHACESMRYPLCFLSLNLPAQEVDVNVDPNKTTVFLQNMIEISKFLEGIILEVYGPLENVPQWHYSEPMKLKDKTSVSEENKMGQTEIKDDSSKKQRYISVWSDKERKHKVHLDLSSRNCSTGGDLCKTVRLAMRDDELTNKPVSTASKLVNNPPQSQVTGSITKSNLKKLEILRADNLLVSKKYDDEIVIDHLAKEAFYEDLLDEEFQQASTINQTHTLMCNGKSNLDNFCQKPPTHCVNSSNLPTNQSVKSPGLFEATDVTNEVSATSWSRGKGLGGENSQPIQPVQLLFPNSHQMPGKDTSIPENDDHNNILKMLCRKRSPSLTSDSKQKSSKSLKANIRDELAAMASQSQAQALQNALKDRIYLGEKHINFTTEHLRNYRKKFKTQRFTFTMADVIGPIKDFDVWIVRQSNQLCLVNVQRMSELSFYKKLMEKHRLPAVPCPVPMCLNSSNVDECVLSTLQDLMNRSYSHADNSHLLKDERITANGFDILCHLDLAGKVNAKLVGMCNIIPAYGVADLIEVLKKISSAASLTVAESRPIKVQYYLQGEAVRCALHCKDRNELSTQLEKEMNNIKSSLSDVECIHHKPVFHTLFDLTSL